MDAKGANPFLFAEDDYASANATSNPFLMAEDDFIDTSANNDNPFLSQTAVSMASNSTNPFAFDPMELEPTEAQPVTDINSTFQPNIGETNTFIDTAINFETTTDLIGTNTSQEFLPHTNAVIPNFPVQKPTGLDLKHTNTVTIIGATNQVNNDVNVQGNGPPRPPPPRPPPSKETQDLLMSVMGAMDATSSHLLDKIPPTRTPSPVSMRDLHSPSPTPEPTFADLLDVSDSKQPETSKSDHANDLLSLSDDNVCDINQNPPLANQNITPIQPITNQPPPRPAPPVARPPRPSPPQKPPPPSFAQQNQSQNVVPPKPPPPVSQTIQPHDNKNQKPSNQNEPKQAQGEMFDMFGMEEVQPQKTVASTADIMNLYSAPLVSKPQHKEPDLLFDSVEPEIKTTEVITSSATDNSNVDVTVSDVNAFVTNVIPPTEPVDSLANTPIVQDNFISPEPSQSDLQMDTSDSQSKGSVSSVTFNPFAGNEENTSPMKQNVQQDNNTNVTTDIFGTNVINTNQTQDIFGFVEPKKTDDEFDAFAMKFESAAKDENKNGAFDAFANDTSAWGNDAGAFNDSSTGFDNEEPFDAFLSMQEPPTVPQSTPNKLSKAPSQDSDEDKDFSVFIR